MQEVLLWFSNSLATYLHAHTNVIRCFLEGYSILVFHYFHRSLVINRRDALYFAMHVLSLWFL